MRGALTNGYEWLFFLLTMDVFLCTDVLYIEHNCEDLGQDDWFV